MKAIEFKFIVPEDPQQRDTISAILAYAKHILDGGECIPSGFVELKDETWEQAKKRLPLSLRGNIEQALKDESA